VDEEYKKLVKGDIAPKSFDFHELESGLSRYNGKSGHRPLGGQQAPSPIDKDRAIHATGQVARMSLKGTPSPETIPSRAADIYVSRDAITGCQRVSGNSTSQDDRTSRPVPKPPISSSVLWRFTRILPFDTIARIINDPTRCVAALIFKPDLRCSRRIKSSQDIKAWLLNHAAKDPSPVADCIGAENYLRNLVELATCTSQHRSISLAQLESLLEICRLNPCGEARTRDKRHAFIRRDEVAIPFWLEALTKISHLQGKAVVRPDQLYHPPILDREPVSTEKILSKAAFGFNNDAGRVSKLHQVSLQESWRVEAIKTVTVTNSTKTTQITQNIGTITNTTENHKINRTLEWKDEVDKNGVVQGKQIEETTSRFNETTKAVMIQVIPGKEKRPETAAALETPVNSNITTTKTAIATTSTFDPTQSLAISWTTTLEDKTSQSVNKKSVQIQSTTSSQLTIYTLGQVFTDYRSSGNRKLSPSTYIRKCLIEPITEQETQRGLIYMYWVKGNFGLVKIGKTSGPSTQKRMTQWETECGHELQEHTRGAVQLPHVYRVERLVHAELDSVRLVERACVKCSERLGRAKSHVEWFRCSPEHAMRVIEKWSQWVRDRNPYEITGKVAGGKTKKNYIGVLKGTVGEDEIARMCTPIEMTGKAKDARPTYRRIADSSSTSAHKINGRSRSL
jgi:hypothetical protein